MGYEIPIDADFTVSLHGVNLLSDNLTGAAVTYENADVAGSVVVKNSAGTTLATGGTITYGTGSNGIWYSAFDAIPEYDASTAPNGLVDGTEYTLVVTITAPVDDKRTIYAVARKRGA